MSTNNKKLVTVFGATGLQGGSVVDALLKDGGFSVRGVTRKPTDEKSAGLKKKGVQVVQGDIVGPIEPLVEAMKGSYAAFLLTNFWDPSTKGKEVENGKKLVDAARKAGVKHVVWSTLANVEKESKGKYDVPHFTDKAKVEEYIRELQSKSPKAFDHVSFVAPAFYYQNFETGLAPKVEGDTYTFTLPPIKTLIAFDVTETGPAVVSALKEPAKYELKRIDYYGTAASPEEYVKTYAKVTGRKAVLNTVSNEAFAKFPFPGAKEFAAMFGWFNEFTYYGAKGDAKSGQGATPGGLSTYEAYLRRTYKK